MDKQWHVIQSITLNASAEEVWNLVGGFFTLQEWCPDIASTKVLENQTSSQAIHRFLTFKGEPASTTTEELTFIDNENWVYRYKWFAGAWGEKVKDYHSEVRVLELVPRKQCLVQWQGWFLYDSDALSAFYLKGLNFLKEKFG